MTLKNENDELEFLMFKNIYIDYRYCDLLVQSCAKSIENFVFRPKMAIFRMAGMREGGLPLPLPFQYLILMI